MKTDWFNWRSPVSKYFTVGEVTNRDSRRIPKDMLTKRRIKKFAAELDKLREKYKYPIRINSWYRPADINKSVGGVSNSQHIFGWAADVEFVAPNTRTKLDIEQDLNKTWKGGVGLGAARKGFTHIDMGPRRRWSY
jgi:uncharacterized protein YcbK (DUF882 family)